MRATRPCSLSQIDVDLAWREHAQLQLAEIVQSCRKLQPCLRSATEVRGKPG